MSTILLEDCSVCHSRFAANDIVVQGVREVSEAVDEPEGAVVHERHWPPNALRGWRETYRGPFSGLH